MPLGFLALGCVQRKLGEIQPLVRLEEEVRIVLGLVDDVATYALMPIGYPEGKFGPLSRRPVEGVAYADRWGTPWPA